MKTQLKNICMNTLMCTLALSYATSALAEDLIGLSKSQQFQIVADKNKKNDVLTLDDGSVITAKAVLSGPTYFSFMDLNEDITPKLERGIRIKTKTGEYQICALDNNLLFIKSICSKRGLNINLSKHVTVGISTTKAAILNSDGTYKVTKCDSDMIITGVHCQGKL